MRLIHRRANADIHHAAIRRRIAAANYFRTNRVNSIRRQSPASRIQVRSGKTNFMSEPVAANYNGRERIRPTQHLAGGIEVADGNRLSNSRAADGFAVE